MVLTTLTIASFVLAAVFAIVAWRASRAERERSQARVTALAAAIDGAPATVDTPPGMFTQGHRSAVQGRPLLKVAIGFAFAVSVIVLIAMTGDSPEREARIAPSATLEAAPPSLELVSMRHTRTGDALTVTGLVRNAGAVTPDGVMAVVLVFDRDGNYVATSRSPLEFPRLAAGDESPFHVTVSKVTDVGRYRVSFRTDAGVVRHVDRRPTLQVSAN
jgi:hypothetical protein